MLATILENLLIFYFHVQEYEMERKQLIKKTVLADRLRFVWMWKGGLSLRSIAHKTQTSATTVRRWVRRWLKEGDLCTKRSKMKLDTSSLHNTLICRVSVCSYPSLRYVILQRELYPSFRFHYCSRCLPY